MLRRAVRDRRVGVSVDFVPLGQPQSAKGAVRIGGEEIDLGYTGRAADVVLRALAPAAPAP